MKSRDLFVEVFENYGYIHQGPYSIVKKTIKERHYDDLDMVDEIMEGFVKL